MPTVSIVDEDSEMDTEDEKQVIAKELRAESFLKREPDDSSNPLQRQLKKNKVTGKGVAMVEKIAYLLSETEDSAQRTTFLQVRLVAPKEKKRSPKTQKKKDA